MSEREWKENQSRKKISINKEDNWENYKENKDKWLTNKQKKDTEKDNTSKEGEKSEVDLNTHHK